MAEMNHEYSCEISPRLTSLFEVLAIAAEHQHRYICVII